jgi:LysR family glycine cleavage system transcriptional activator
MALGVSMVRRLPPLNALKAFEAAARHENFTHAAAELCVTQGAVSHQVKSLEDDLGVKLFIRGQQRLAITEAGKSYLVFIREALDKIATGTERLLQQQHAGILMVSTSPSFASKWLAHRLGRFAETHPGIDLRISATLHHVDFAREDIDIAIRHGDGVANGLHITRLCTEELVPVCSPALLAGRNCIRKPEDLSRHTLLHINDRSDWARWVESAGLKTIDASRGPILSQASMVLDAAAAGQGVALGRSALAAPDLIAGRLVRLFTLSLPLRYSYWIVCPKASAHLPKMVLFRDWLLTEAAEDARRVQRVT